MTMRNAHQAPASPQSHAGEAADALSACLTDAVTLDDRRALARWIFSVLSEHPDVKSLTAIDNATRTTLEMEGAAVFERLIVKDCTEQSRTTLAEEGTDGFGKAFETVGQVAMGSVVEHPQVQTAMAGLGEHVDANTLFRALLSQ